MRILMICNYRSGVGGISGQVDTLRAHLRAEGHHADLFGTRGSPWQRLRLWGRLLRVARGYDLLHVHCCSGWGFLPAVMGVSVGRRLGKRVVLTYHGGEAEAFFSRCPHLVRHWLTRTDCNIVLNRFSQDIFLRHGLPCTVIPNIVDTDPDLFRQRETIAPHYICTRAHEELYNIPCILRAYRQVKKQLPQATLTLVGDGSRHEALKQMAAEMGLQDVVFTGRVDNSEIYHLLDQADIMLSSPRIDNMPVSLIEAMNAGLLVIASHVGGVPCMIEHGKTGLLFASDHSDQLARLMLQAVERPAASLDIIRQAHREAARYRWPHIQHSIHQAYGIRS